METETMAKLYQELSQVLGADVKTERELELRAENERLRAACRACWLVLTAAGGPDVDGGLHHSAVGHLRAALYPQEVTDGQR